jgi:hypothetical protein
MSLRESPRFLTPDALPAFTSTTPLTRIYADLNRANVGDFFLHGPGGELDLIRGDALAKGIDSLRAGGAWEQLARVSVGEALRRVDPQEVRVPVAKDDLDETSSEEGLGSLPATVFRVLRAGRLAGYYFNRKAVAGTGPRRVVFICRRGHRNPDPDGGRCYQCPSPIVSTGTE